MSLERVRKSLQIIFGIDKNTTTREPLIQERISQEFVYDSKMNEQHQNKFSMMNQQRKRSNQYYYALDRLRSFYQNKAQSNEYDQIPVITYLGDNTEKKLNLNMNHARWNQQDRFHDNDSSNYSSQFGEKLVQKSSNILASVSKQDFKPYYVQDQYRDNFNNQQSQISQQQQNNLMQSQKQLTIFGGNKSKVHFLREDKQSRSKSNKPESNFKRLGGILEDDFLIPSFLKDQDVQDKKFKEKEVQSNNKFIGIQPFNFSTLSKINNKNESQLQLNGSHQQIDFNEIYSQNQADKLRENDQINKKPITHKKSNQIKFWEKDPINEKNPFIIQTDETPLWENRFKPPWQIQNPMQNVYNEFEPNEKSENLSIKDYEQQQENQEQKSSASFEQQVNISFGGCDINLSDDHKDENIERKPPKNQLIFDTFVNPKFNFENHTPLSKEKAINIQKQLDFSEQTPRKINKLLINKKIIKLQEIHKLLQ
ncbi:unnamed protein product [Paramecium pentaurelia]|uniref:Uncharacterized protein n=1 Tax=Paramecium pentaurelia TaxID=43138 RepID=A0A8S1SUQ2_9CILI|nr:unnamed protein product [Paramecium pentaurelia]